MKDSANREKLRTIPPMEDKIQPKMSLLSMVKMSLLTDPNQTSTVLSECVKSAKYEYAR
jgi:hypothetical protein